MKKFWTQNRVKIIVSFLAGILFIGAMSIIALLSGAVMSMFGFRCRSVGSAILFFIVAAIVSYPASMVANSLPKTLLHLGKIPRQTAIPLYVLLDTVATALGFKIVDYFMESVSATDFSIMVVSLLLAIIGVRNIGEPPKEME